MLRPKDDSLNLGRADLINPAVLNSRRSKCDSHTPRSRYVFLPRQCLGSTNPGQETKARSLATSYSLRLPVSDSHDVSALPASSGGIGALRISTGEPKSFFLSSYAGRSASFPQTVLPPTPAISPNQAGSR